MIVAHLNHWDLPERCRTKVAFRLFCGVMLAWLSLGALLQQALAAEPAGKVSLVKGVVTVSQDANSLRTLDRGSPVYAGETIATASESFVVIQMRDQGKLTLRPNTELVVREFSDQPGQEAEKLRLVKGGLRVVTGLVGKLRPEAVELETRTTTIGIRGSDFGVIDCRGQCQDEEERHADNPRVAAVRKRDNQVMPDVLVQVGGKSEKVIREPVDPIQNAVYFAVYDGGIWAQSMDERIELDAIDACFRGGENGGAGDRFHCLLEIPRFLLHDEYLNADRDEFTLFEIFSDLDGEGDLCEVDW